MEIPGTVRQRIAAALLSASAAAFVGLASSENYVDVASIPVKGDVPTYGFGMTTREDGTPVRIGDRTTPARALKRSLEHVQRDESAIHGCVTAPLAQGEYDQMVDFSYQYGARALCGGSIVAQANLGNYFGSCQAYLAYRFQGADHFDCSSSVGGQPNKRCYGVWTRQLKRYAACMAAQ